MTQNEHVYATCCRPEVAGDVISGQNVKTIECYVVLNFEVGGFISFRDIKKIHFVTANRPLQFRAYAKWMMVDIVRLLTILH